MLHIGVSANHSKCKKKDYIINFILLFEYVNHWNEINNRLTTFSDEYTQFNRLDRSNILNIEKHSDEFKIKIKLGVYSDFHLPRQKCFKQLIIKLIFDY